MKRLVLDLLPRRPRHTALAGAGKRTAHWQDTWRWWIDAGTTAVSLTAENSFENGPLLDGAIVGVAAVARHRRQTGRHRTSDQCDVDVHHDWCRCGSASASERATRRRRRRRLCRRRLRRASAAATTATAR